MGPPAVHQFVIGGQVAIISQSIHVPSLRLINHHEIQRLILIGSAAFWPQGGCKTFVTTRYPQQFSSPPLSEALIEGCFFLIGYISGF